MKCFHCVIDREYGFYGVQSPLLLLSVLAIVRSTVRVWKDIVMSDAQSIIDFALGGLVKKEYEGIFLQFLYLFVARACDVLTQRRDTRYVESAGVLQFLFPLRFQDVVVTASLRPCH